MHICGQNRLGGLQLGLGFVTHLLSQRVSGQGQANPSAGRDPNRNCCQSLDSPLGLLIGLFDPVQKKTCKPNTIIPCMVD